MGRSEETRDLQFWLNGQRVAAVAIGTELKPIEGPVLELPPGVSEVELRSGTPPTGSGTGAARPLGFVFYGIELEVLADGASAKE